MLARMAAKGDNSGRNDPDLWSALMAAALMGDRAAYRTVLSEAAPYVRAIAGRTLRNPADVEDVVQDVLLTVHAMRHLYDPARPFRPWLAGIARHRIADRVRRDWRRRRDVPLAPAHETFSDDAANRGDRAVDATALRAAVAALPAGQRQAIELMKLREMSLQDAAALTGLSITALKVATHRAVRRLRRALGTPDDGKPA
jgi:RNA polymerase sigma factor (sigma-70 family)